MVRVVGPRDEPEVDGPESEANVVENADEGHAGEAAEDAAVTAAEMDDDGAEGMVELGQEHLSGFGSYRFLAHALEELGLPAKPLAAVVRLPPLPVLRSEPLCVLGLGDTRGIGFTSCRRQSQPGAGSHRDWARGIRAWWRVGEEAAQERLKNFLEVLARGDFEGRKRLLSDEKNTRYEQERPKANATFLRRFMWRDLAYWFLWEFPSLPHTSLRLQYEEQAWNGTDVELKKWQKGVTGFPLVDAAMRQLWHVGWMPNYVRHDWFDWTLVDADVAINSFMWQNGGHSGPDQWEFVLHPVNAAKSCDPLGTYVRRWVPELRSCPAESSVPTRRISSSIRAGPKAALRSRSRSHWMTTKRCWRSTWSFEASDIEQRWSSAVGAHQFAAQDKYPDPVPATMNAVTFRTIFTKMDFVERIREVRYQGKCPRETLLINSFYLRFSQKARAHGIKVTSPVCSQWTQKYKPEAPMEKRSYEWYFPETKQRLHLGLHDAKEEEDLWIFLRQLTGLEDLNAAKEFIWNNAGKYGLEAFRREEVSLVLGCFVRWSEKARMMGLLSSTKLRAVHKDGKSDLKEEEDLWTWILDLSRVPMQSLVGAEEAREHDPWKDGSWKSKAREMWNRPVSDKVEVVSTPKQDAWWEDMAVRDEKANQATQSSEPRVVPRPGASGRATCDRVWAPKALVGEPFTTFSEGQPQKAVPLSL
eukprot:g22467.t1